MSQAPTYLEETISQLPSLQLLINLGYTYLPPAEALHLRGGKRRNVILTGLLEPQLRQLNHITFKGQRHPFSDANIRQAIERLTNEPYDGLIRTNEKLSELLTLGTSLTQTIDGDTKSFSLNYIDWQHPERNVYHVSDEFEVERSRSNQTCRPDIVCFVNGIPLAIIECKRPDLTTSEGKRAVDQAISQHIRNQKAEYIPHLFIYSQLLLAISVNDALYATTGTAAKFWSKWREEDAGTAETLVHRLINKRLAPEEKQPLYNWRNYAGAIWQHFEELERDGQRLPTSQDRLLHALLRPERLLELAYQFTVFDGGVKKIARHQQYFAVKETVARVGPSDGFVANGQQRRSGGVIWHTTGSGKSLTMVMLAKALALHPAIPNPKVVIVTDRIDLDTQIWRTFEACGKRPVKANSGRHLIELVQSTSADVITTIIDKFETVAAEKVSNPNPNIFVLVDESHRSQYGAIHAMMRRVFPNACYIGFTGTPLLKKEKSTADKFGSFIHTYPIRRAVEDQAVVPLLYEGRLVELQPNQATIDLWFERVTKELSEEQKKDLKRKFSRQDEVNKAEQRIQQIAYDISEHYAANFQGQGFKAQLAVPSKAIALQYKRFLDEFGMISSAVVISPPDTREGHESVDEVELPAVQAFWKQMMAQYQNEKNYLREILDSFGHEDGIELLIVVDKLLTGFDQPRNTVLYLDKPLKEHSLLQAISRVNRLFENKPYGYIIDYRGVLGELNETLNVYDALAGFDPDDVEGTITDVDQIIRSLPDCHSAVWVIFAPVANKRDIEQMERFLEPENIREQFYEALRAFVRAFAVAASTVTFYERVDEQQIGRYKRDLNFFTNLRNSVRLRYAERIEYSAYDKQIRKLMDRHIDATEVKEITAQVNIFDVEAFTAEVEKLEGTTARADAIANRIKQTISEHLEEDPAYYKKFSELIEETIQAYRQGRLDEADYYQRMQGHHSDFAAGSRTFVPPQLRPYAHAPAYYGILSEYIQLQPTKDDAKMADALAADAAIRIEHLIEARKIRDWTSNTDVQNQMKNDIEDYLFQLQTRYNLPLTYDDMDLLLEQLIHTARQRNNL